MPASLTVLRLVVGLGLTTGVALAYWQPRGPLLGYWLLLSIALGVAVSTASSLAGLARRAKWLLSINAIIVAFALATTQLAARRAISSTHLEYRGVHLVGVDSFTVGAGDADADVRLQSVSSATPWSLRIARQGHAWTVEPRAGIEQLRVGPVGKSRGARRFTVAQSTILANGTDWVAIVDPSGAVVDTLRLAGDGLKSATSNSFSLRPVNGAIAARYRRQLRAGVALSALDGHRAAPSPYERFVRVQVLAGDEVNGVVPTLAQRAAWSLPFIPERMSPSKPLLVAASPPYSLRGPSLDSGLVSFADSALVEVRSAGVSWDFELRARRREPSADVGLDLLFIRNPRALDTPLPTGVSCRAGVACGAISLRRLPPPVAHVALDFAGFDPARFGMLGKVQQDDDGFTVVLPRQAYRVERGAARPVAIPVTSLREVQNVSETRAPNRFWVLLSASGTFGDDMPTIGFIGLGLALLLAAIYTGVQASMPGASPVSRDDEKWLSLGIAAILALLLTRVIIGARVAFFAPFLRRSIETAVGMWVAIAIVAVGLLSWSAWVPALLTGARNALAGQIALRRLLSNAVRAPLSLWTTATSSRARMPALLTLLALLSLGRATPAAVVNGVVAGVVVLLAWICLAWVAAFAGYYFETFERGAWSVVEQLAPTNRLSASSDQRAQHGWRAWFDAWNTRVPELPMIVACFAAELALLPRLTAALAIAASTVIVATPFVIRRRRSAGAVPSLPDYWGALVGAAVFTLAIAVLRLQSENGSMAAFVMIVFVALASVRIGRGVGSRIDPADRRAPVTREEWRDVLVSSALLVAPLALLAPLMFIDMGLFLVVVVPVGFATLLAAGRRVAGWRLAIPGVAFLTGTRKT